MEGNYIRNKEIESKIFDKKIGQFSVLDILTDNDWDMIDVRIPSDRYITSIITYELDTRDITRNIGPLYVDKNCREASEKDLDECIRITKESFVYIADGGNRFNLDERFKDYVEKYYIEYCKNIFKDRVIVYDDGRIKGYIGIKKTGQTGQTENGRQIYKIQLNAVERNSREIGIYTNLVQYILYYAKQLDAIVTITTYGNFSPVRRAWTRLGAKFKGEEYVFHLWR